MSVRDGGFRPAHYTSVCGASFAQFVAEHSPDLLPSSRVRPASLMAPASPHGTTIVAVTHATGVLMAGDRRATMGNVIAQRDIEKVFPADEYSCVGIAGAAGIGIELVRLYQVELEHYEKLEGTTLSLEGKANRLSTMVRSNLGAAMQGLAVVPIFAGYDLEAGAPSQAGRIFSYDVTGGRYEEHSFHAVGSGSVFARSALKKRYRDGSSENDAIVAAVESLYDAADDDSATGGPDLTRRIFPVVITVSQDGHRRLSDDEVGAVVERVVEGRMVNPGG